MVASGRRVDNLGFVTPSWKLGNHEMLVAIELA